MESKINTIFELNNEILLYGVDYINNDKTLLMRINNNINIIFYLINNTNFKLLNYLTIENKNALCFFKDLNIIKYLLKVGVECNENVILTHINDSSIIKILQPYNNILIKDLNIIKNLNINSIQYLDYLINIMKIPYTQEILLDHLINMMNYKNRNIDLIFDLILYYANTLKLNLNKLIRKKLPCTLLFYCNDVKIAKLFNHLNVDIYFLISDNEYRYNIFKYCIDTCNLELCKYYIFETDINPCFFLGSYNELIYIYDKFNYNEFYREEFFKLFLTQKTFINNVDKLNPLLKKLIDDNNFKYIEILLYNNMNPNIKIENKTLLMYIFSDQLNITNKLLKYKVNPTIKDNNNKYAYDYHNNNIEVFTLLKSFIKNDIDLDIIDPQIAGTSKLSSKILNHLNINSIYINIQNLLNEKKKIYKFPPNIKSYVELFINYTNNSIL